MPADAGGDDNYHLRLLSPADDLVALTAMLHRAYAALARRDMHFLASHQGVDVTRSRLEKGECWVADADGVIIGTIVLKDAASTRGSPWYDRPDVACFGQFAVEPAWQGRGIGSALVDQVERRAQAKGIAELALDTAEGAADLIAFYTRRGYRFIEHTKWNDVNYRSVIMSKRIDEQPKKES
jgi:GNAT superfamily N-acetyltransferase